MRIRSLAALGAALSTTLVFAGACGSDATSEAGVNRIDVAMTSAGIVVSGPVRPGGTLHIHNDDTQMHMMLLARLHDGKTLKDASKAIESDDDSAINKIADDPAAPSTHLPPGQSVYVSTAAMKPGHYIVADFYPNEGGDGTPNVFKTGLGELVVSGPRAASPASDVTYVMEDGKPISGPAEVVAGHHTFRFTGLSTEDGKEISVQRLNPGETVEAISTELFNLFDANDGNGLTVKGAGERVAQHVMCWVLPPAGGGALDVGLDLTPGTYALVASDIDADNASKPIVEQLTIKVR